MKFHNKIILALTLMLTLSSQAAAQTIENPQFFGSQPALQETDQGRNIASCLKGWRQFIAAGIGYEDFTDYWRDFFLWPAHYADVMNVQDQLNRTRYQVMSAFLRCDLTRLASVTSSYYRLEAELYYVRHFVDTSNGYLHILTENSGDKNKFVREMSDYMILLKPAANEDEERALYSGYFNLFESQYADRARRYASFGNDPVFAGLSAKFDELIDSFKSFGTLGGELKQLGNEAIVEPAQAVGAAAVSLYKSPLKTIGAAARAIADRFDACVETEDNRYCVNSKNREGSQYGISAKDIPFSELFMEDKTKKRTFSEVLSAVKSQEALVGEDMDAAEMLSRYEMLYGATAGDGIKDVVSAMDNLLLVIGEGRRADSAHGVIGIQGSLESLNKVKSCAQSVVSRECR